MKNLILFILICLIIISCKKDNHSGNHGISIKGSISGNTVKGTGTKGQTSSLLSDAKKVLVFSANTFSHGMTYSLVDIINGTFSASAQTGNATALVFLDSNNGYIGNLCTDGLNMLPLVNLSEGDNTAIDLSSLTLSENHVLPSHDPFGNEIILTPDEVASFRNMDACYGTLAKNIDTDNNGTPDVLDHAEIVVNTDVYFMEGQWGTDNSKPVLSDTSELTINYQMYFQGGTALTFSSGNITLAGPMGNPYSQINTANARSNPNEGVGFMVQFMHSDPATGNSSAFASGTYSLTLDGSHTHTLYYSSLNNKKNIILGIPTLHTDSNGQLTSVSLDFQFLDGKSINPSDMLASMMLQISYTDLGQWSSPAITRENGFTSYTFSTPLDLSKISSFTVSYDDLLGNRYMADWKK